MGEERTDTDSEPKKKKKKKSNRLGGEVSGEHLPFFNHFWLFQ